MSQSTLPDIWLGRTLADDFQITRLLGEGGFGRVYLARQLSVKREVVIKLIKRALTGEAAVIERFRQEARIVANINHPNVVQVYSAGETDEGIHYVVMEYVRGRTLEELLRDEVRLSEARVLRIAEQVAGALAAAHEAGVVHRDLKPANVMLTKITGQRDLVKVLDFGMAKLVASPFGKDAEVTATGAIVGTPAYMSPEQVSGHLLDGRSDIYTLGLMVYEMLTGHHPYTAETPVEFIVQHLQEPVRSVSSRHPELKVSRECDALIRRCCAKERARRFASAEGVQVELRELYEKLTQRAQDVVTEDHRVSARSTGPASSRLGRFGAMVALAFLIVAGLLVAERTGLLDEGPEPETRAPRLEPPARGERVIARSPRPDPIVDDTGVRDAVSEPRDEDGEAGSAVLGAPNSTLDPKEGSAAAEAVEHGLRGEVPPNPPEASGSAAEPLSAQAPKPGPARVPAKPNGPGDELLPVGSTLRFGDDRLVIYVAPYRVADLALLFRSHYGEMDDVLITDGGVSDPEAPGFSLMFLGRSTGVTMISVTGEADGRAALNYLATGI